MFLLVAEDIAVRVQAAARGWRNRQTRTVQVRVPERAWGFNSPLAHSECQQESRSRDRDFLFAPTCRRSQRRAVGGAGVGDGSGAVDVALGGGGAPGAGVVERAGDGRVLAVDVGEG